MKTIVPSYYPSFSCIAGACTHSCCIGWEIDIDEDTAAYYRTVSGTFGTRLKDNILSDGNDNCFRLGNNERCPFLNQDGLCDIIITLGEDGLCRICDDHPRFRNYFTDRTEIGLGLCCEAAGRLLLSQSEKCTWITTEDDGIREKTSPEEREILAQRDRIFSVLQDRTQSIDARLERVLLIAGKPKTERNLSDWQKIYRSLERMDGEWDTYLALLDEDIKREKLPPQYETCMEQLAVYFIYRHLAGATDDGFVSERIRFAVHATEMIRTLCSALYAKNGTITLEDIVQTARLYSSEIEYSDENPDRLLQLLA